MTRSRQVLGQAGEELAARLLGSKGYRLVGRNVRLKGGEIDIVAWDGHVLVFVEVRTRRGALYGSALESVDARKRERLMRLARAYLLANRISDVNCRFDVVSVTFRPGASSPEVNHVQDAFTA